jgi:hypothetical protein
MTYEGNPKHKEPWQPGRRGSMCPDFVTIETAQQLLDGSVAAKNARYATIGGLAFCAREHRPEFWHGYPVGWREVPVNVRLGWIGSGIVKRSDVRKNW